MENLENGRDSDSEELNEESEMLHTVSEICSFVAEQHDVIFSEDFLDVLMTTTFQRIKHLSEMMEYFAKHGKRTEINIEDFRLYFKPIPKIKNRPEEIKSGKNSFMEFLLTNMSFEIATDDDMLKRTGNLRSRISKEKVVQGPSKSTEATTKDDMGKRTRNLRSRISNEVVPEPSKTKEITINDNTLKRTRSLGSRISKEKVQVPIKSKAENDKIRNQGNEDSGKSQFSSRIRKPTVYKNLRSSGKSVAASEMVEHNKNKPMNKSDKRNSAKNAGNDKIRNDENEDSDESQSSSQMKKPAVRRSLRNSGKSVAPSKMQILEKNEQKMKRKLRTSPVNYCEFSVSD